MKAFLLAATLFLAACASQPPVPTIDLAAVHGDTYVTCHSNLEKVDVNYLKSTRHDYPSPTFPSLIISNLTDVHGKVWTINSQEWTVFSCNEKELP